MSTTINTDVYYNDTGHVYLIEDNRDKSLSKIKRVLEFAKSIGLTVPGEEDIKVEVIKSKYYKDMLSVEFKSKTKPTEGNLLAPDNGLWIRLLT